jgi:hypothetical protein
MSMSDVQQGPDWWLAVDGRWYPPERHPNYRPPASASTPTESRTGSAANRVLSAPPVTGRVTDQSSNRPAGRFEYRAASFWTTVSSGLPPADEPITQWLNGWGAEGWELVEVVRLPKEDVFEAMYYFRRVKPQQ